MAKSKLDQGCLFEHDYLRRTLGPIANAPEVALTELVANAWDAGASDVKIVVPEDLGDYLTIEDNGTGMSEQAFRQKWMTLGYDRIGHQGGWAERPGPVCSQSNPPHSGTKQLGRVAVSAIETDEQRKRKTLLEWVDKYVMQVKMPDAQTASGIGSRPWGANHVKLLECTDFYVIVGGDGWNRSRTIPLDKVRIGWDVGQNCLELMEYD